MTLVALSSPALAVAGQGAGWALRLYDPSRAVVFLDGPGACRRPADIAPLARLPAGLVVSFVDLGPAILAETGHSILAAPYHRNVAGNRIAFDVLLGADLVAERALRARAVDLIAICPGGPERLNYESAAPQGLVARLSRGEVPPYLEAIAGKPDEPMRVFRVRR